MIKEMDTYDELMEGAEDPYYIPIFCVKHDKLGWKEFKAKGKKKSALVVQSPNKKSEGT